MNTRTILTFAFAGLFAAAAIAAPVGVTVNGTALDSAGSDGEGWTYVSPTLRLTNAGPFTLSGMNTSGVVRVVVTMDVTSEVTLSNLTLVANNNNNCVFTLETNTAVALFLTGTNTLTSGNNRAGLEVAGGRTLSITNAPGDETATLTASGGEGGAGIGGNYNNACGTVTINGGQVSASGRGYYGAGIGGGRNGAGGTITINGGTVTAQGARHGAGIGGGYYYQEVGGTVTINGGVVTATGGRNGAGIGGGGNGQGGTVIISAGVVTAQGGTYGAGIGGGQAGAGGNVTISAGVVTAMGGSGGAGIGGGSYSGEGGNVTISGGTVTAIGSSNAKDIGPGNNGTVSGVNIFTGGTIHLGASLAFHAPSNATEQVFCAIVTGFAPNEPVTLTGLGAYGVNDIFADGDGCIYLWLPNGTHTFQANGNARTVKIANGAGPTGVMVNGEEIASPAGPPVGWSFDATNRTLSLTGAGPFTISGTNGAGGVRIAVSNSVTGTVTLSNLTLRTGSGQGALTLGTGAQLSLALAGTNTLTSGRNFAGIEVATGRTLSITNAPGDETATLMVTGGGNGAGIGGNLNAAAGTVNISGGIITAAGGSGAAGIGGGFLGAGGTVNVSGGAVTAFSANYGAGIGGGGEKAGGTVNISGGMVTAIGGGSGAGIGGGSYDGTGGAGGTVNISGGTVVAEGADGGMDMGPGRDSTSFGANTFAGGSICLANDSLSPIPRNNNGKAVFCATVSGFVAGARVVFTNPGNLPAYYGKTDIFADDGGNIYLWLPNGTYTFTANGQQYTVVLDETTGATGVTVNGDEVAYGPDDPATAGWSYDEATQILRLTNAGPFTISGTNTEGKVRTVVAAGVTDTVTLSNLTLQTTNDDRCIFTLGSGANVMLTLAGSNVLVSGSGRPGIWVEAGETLSITNAPGDDAASLSVTGGANAAGIGGCTYQAAGTVNISGGIIMATSGTRGAGIGGGYNRVGGTVNISGGTVMAISTYAGAGIGGGDAGAGGSVTISGGKVIAIGSDGGAGIGGGNGRAGGTVNISGGTVAASGSYGGADIGPGDNHTDSGPNTFTGGSIYLARDNIAPDPSNITERVWCVTVPGLTPYAVVVVTGLGTAYGVNDLFADNSGKLYLWLPNGNYDFTVGETEYTANVADADTTAIQKSPPASNAHLTFYSTNAFTITPQTNSWDGTLESSTDTTNWVVFTTNGADAADNGADEYQLHIRGTANNRISANDVNAPGWTITASTGTVACYGNIETLLDYATVTNGGHPAMDAWCFANLFNGCTALRRAPVLPGTTLTNHCYRGMFSGCTGLTKTPALPATNLADSCYMNMFRGCTSLANASALPAATLAYACYSGMFLGCTGLTQAPSLSATNLDTACYMNMFKGCTSLTDAPALPAATLAHSCYSSMFSDCVSLTEPPALSAATLAHSCYSKMFSGCLGLTNLPALPAKNLADYCYSQMFNGCIGIKLNAVGPGPEWGIPAGAISASQWNVNMLFGTGGTFTNDPVIGVTYYLPLVAPVAPSGVSASDGTFTNKIRITWNATSLATGYRVWRHTANNSAAATEIGSTTGTSYDDVATVAKTTYYYWVKATNSAGVSGFSAPDTGWRAEPKPPKPAAPTGVAASDGAHTDKVRVTWKASAGATSYRVYRHTSNNPNAASQIGTSATTAYNDKTAKTGLTYYYWVKAVNASGASGFSAADTGYLGVVGPLVMVNGMVGNNIRIPANKPITIAATMMNLPAAYLGVPVDWWVAAYVHQGGLWFYFDTNFNLVQFDGNLANCRPAYQGPLFNVPPMALVENMVLPRGTYNVWFAVDYPMDGKIDLNGLILLSSVTIVVEP